MKFVIIAAIILAALAAVRGVPAKADTAEKITCKLRKDEDRATPHSEPGALVVAITSPSGIGGGTIDTGGTAAPAVLSLRFLGLRSMEGIKLATSGLTFEGHLRADEESSVKLFDSKGREVKEVKDAAYHLTLRQLGKGKGVEVQLRHPGATPKGRRWQLEWVDAFR